MKSQQKMGNTGCSGQVKCVAPAQLNQLVETDYGNDTYSIGKHKRQVHTSRKSANFSLTYKHTQIHIHLFQA